MAGSNEQTLFAVAHHTLVAVIRDRDHLLGGIPGTNPRSSDCLFFRAESGDRGETWSSPEPTDRLAFTRRLPGSVGPPAVSLEPPPRPLVP